MCIRFLSCLLYWDSTDPWTKFDLGAKTYPQGPERQTAQWTEHKALRAGDPGTISNITWSRSPPQTQPEVAPQASLGCDAKTKTNFQRTRNKTWKQWNKDWFHMYHSGSLANLSKTKDKASLTAWPCQKLAGTSRHPCKTFRLSWENNVYFPPKKLWSLKIKADRLFLSTERTFPQLLRRCSGF